MDRYEDIGQAAHDHVWHECARLMFEKLYRSETEGQFQVAKSILNQYSKIWNSKHESDSWARIYRILAANKNKGRPEVPDFGNTLDAADAEFENALLEYYNGLFDSSNHNERTKHLATAIRSAVTATQINSWIHDYPYLYERWKLGRSFDGPTFLDDEEAARAAEKMWKFVNARLKRKTISSSQYWASPSSAETRKLYETWEESIP